MKLSNYLDAFEATVLEVRSAVSSVRGRDFHVNFLNISPHYFNNAELAPMDGRRTASALGAAMKARGIPSGSMEILDMIYLWNARRFLIRGETGFPCEAGRSSLFIDSRGVVYLCHIFDRPILSLRESGFMLNFGEAFRESVSLIDKGKCPGCFTPCEAYQSILAELYRRFSFARPVRE